MLPATLATNPCSVREFAERVLLSDSLAEKLTPAPKTLTIDPPKRGTFAAPKLPGRPAHLLPQANPGRSPFPSDDQIHNEEQRGILLHFFANHELLAVELMALALLKFPDAPDSFRRGVLRTLHEEQNHTRWYLQRLHDLGTEFGSYHLSPMIWSHISSMTSPLDYVSRLSLTFEQANLDYAKHYSQVLKNAGDPESAALLHKIYHDEIAHVGYGLKWLRRWKENAQTDWDAWHQQLHFPLSPIRAKGLVPFNEEGRRRAGLNDHFIRALKNFQASRGRSPDLYWFNPEVEITTHHPNQALPQKIHNLAADLESAFALAAPSSDDLVLLRRLPSDHWRESLAQKGLTFPEIAPLDQKDNLLKTRKIRQIHPWGQSNPTLLSRQLTLDLRQILPFPAPPAQICTTPKEVTDFLSTQSPPDWLAKPLYSSAGRGLIRFPKDSPPPLKSPHLIEPWLEKTREFSLLYQANPPEQGGLRFLAVTHQIVSPTGQWLASLSAPKATHQLPAAEARLMATEVLPAAKTSILDALNSLLAPHSYVGPICLDSFFYQDAQGLHWHPVSEINVRWSMGRLAHQFRNKLDPKSPLLLATVSPKEAQNLSDPNLIILADPTTATSRVPILKLNFSH